MTLQEQLKVDLKNAMKAKETEKTSAIRVLMGEFSRQGEKELSDDQIIAIIKKLIKSEKELLAAKGKDDSAFITIMEAYLPHQASDEEIKAWVKANINFDDFANKMQAMRPIMAHFGAGADGNTVKKILAEF